jgi:ribosomal RNA-processing protein 36
VDHFGIVKNFAFIQDARREELKDLGRMIKDAETGEAEGLKRRRKSLQDQVRTFDTQLKDVTASLAWHEAERRRVAEGKKPFWLDRGSLRRKQREEREAELAATGRLAKYARRKGRKQRLIDRRRGAVAGVDVFA